MQWLGPLSIVCHLCGKTFMESSDDADHLGRYPVVPQQPPQNLCWYYIGLFEIYEVDIQGGLPLDALLHYNPQLFDPYSFGHLGSPPFPLSDFHPAQTYTYSGTCHVTFWWFRTNALHHLSFQPAQLSQVLIPHTPSCPSCTSSSLLYSALDTFYLHLSSAFSFWLCLWCFCHFSLLKYFSSLLADPLLPVCLYPANRSIHNLVLNRNLNVIYGKCHKDNNAWILNVDLQIHICWNRMELLSRSEDYL